MKKPSPSPSPTRRRLGIVGLRNRGRFCLVCLEVGLSLTKSVMRVSIPTRRMPLLLGGESAEALSNPKKRGKAAGGGGASRMVSQEMRGGDSRILSPKSQNSRTYPQSPFRGFAERSQQSGYLSKPVSPLKPSSPLRANSSVNSGTSATTSSKHASQTGRPGSRTGTAAKGTRSPLPRPATRQVERRNSVSSNASC